MLPPLHPAFARNVVYPVYRGLRGDRVLELLAGMERNQWLTIEEVEDLQWRLLLRLLEHIHTRVPYYGDLFAGHGLRVNEIQSPADFRKIPLLTREIVHTEGARLTSRDPFTRGYASTASVPGGDPIHFSCDRAAGPVRRANTLRGYRWAGVDVGGAPGDFPGRTIRRLMEGAVLRCGEELLQQYHVPVFFRSLRRRTPAPCCPDTTVPARSHRRVSIGAHAVCRVL